MLVSMTMSRRPRALEFPQALGPPPTYLALVAERVYILPFQNANRGRPTWRQRVTNSCEFLWGNNFRLSCLRHISSGYPAPRRCQGEVLSKLQLNSQGNRALRVLRGELIEVNFLSPNRAKR